MKLEINYKKKTRKIVNMWRLSMLLNNHWANEKKAKERLKIKI